MTLRAKAADDTADGRGEEAARDLLGHESVKTTQRHYLRRGKIVHRQSRSSSSGTANSFYFLGPITITLRY